MAEPLSGLSFHRLLVAVDGSENVSPDVHATATWPGTPAPPAQLQDDAGAYAQRVLREALERIPEDIGGRSVFTRGPGGPGWPSSPKRRRATTTRSSWVPADWVASARRPLPRG